MVISPKQVFELPVLRSIYICQPGLISLRGEQLDAEEFMVDRLPVGKKPTQDAFQPFLVRTSISVNDIPTCFGTSPSQSDLPCQFSPGLKELGESIQYEFSDGTVVTAQEILYHPFSVRVPNSLLPLLSQIQGAVTHLPWIKLLPKSLIPQWGSLRTAEQSLLSILMEAPNYAAKKTAGDPFLIWLTGSSDRTIERPACQIREIGIQTKLSAHWELAASSDDLSDQSASARVVYREIPASPGGKLLETLEFNPKNQSLNFHPYSRNIELGVQTLMNAEESAAHLKNLRPFEFTLSGHRSIQRILEEMDQKLSYQGFTPIARTSQVIIPESKIKSHLKLQKDGHIQFYREFEFEDRPYLVWNFPSLAEIFVRGLEGGIGSTNYKDHRVFAQDRKGLRRDRDLKVLKHSGVFALILLETLSFALRKKSFEGRTIESLDDFFKNLYERLGVLLYEIERKAGFIDLNPAPSLDRLCSKNVIDLIRGTMIKVLGQFEENRDSIFISSGEVRMTGGIHSIFRLFYSLLSKSALNSRGQCFLKLRASIFPRFLGDPKASKEIHFEDLSVSARSDFPADTADSHSDQAQSYFPIGNWLSSGQILHALLPLHHQGLNILYEGLPLNEMKMEEFNPEFTLIEETDEQSGNQPIDWFELHPKFFFKGVEIDSRNLERLSREGVLEFQGKIYLIQNRNLPSVRRLEAFWAKIQGSQPVLTRRKTQDIYFRVPRSHTLEILALRSTGVKVHGGKRWQEICVFYDSLDKPREPVQIPASLKAELKPYQKSGVRWLLDLFHLNLGGILADDMGLGKTIQTLAFLECLRTEKKMGFTLIVVPTSLTYNWMSESAKFTPELPNKIFQSKQKNEITDFLAENSQCVVICTYGLFTEHQDFFEKIKWNILVFDEAQNLKNITAKRTTASRSIPARFKICLTGTPLENHLGEFYSLLDLAVSGSLGDLSEFREKFVNPEVLDPAEVKYLKLKAKPLVLRRTKSEILKELPPKLESTIKLPFEPKQEKIYRDIALSWNEKVKDAILSQGEAKSQILMLTALLRLRQACSDPGSIPNIVYSEEPPKITVLMEALQEITESGESALVFTQFLHTFERIKKELAKNKIIHFSLHGGTSRPERERILQGFQNCTQGSVLLMTLKTGGVGLNLVKASYVFHLEPWWNPAVENQATDRAHRIGQQKPVQVYRYLMKESVEEKIEILKERKSAQFNTLFSSTENESDKELTTTDGRLTQADFEYLLG